MEPSTPSIPIQQSNSSQNASVNQQNTSASSSTGPQIRSRITVVCAECKRLKLKCDRRSPCGSCTKRDTIPRCIYSPAAAEKVDLHSLNNRLIQVESILSMITAGQVPPPFQSTYPLSAATSAGSHSLPFHGSHQHHHHYAAPSSSDDSFMLSSHDIATLWLNDIDAGFTRSEGSNDLLTQNGSSNQEITNCIKLEPSSGDVDLFHSHSHVDNNPVIIDLDGSQVPSRSRPPTPLADRHLHSQKHSAHLFLPPLSIYYPAASISLSGTSSSNPFPQHPSPHAHSMGSFTNGLATPPQSSKPQVTPGLIGLLPPLSKCRSLLQKAGEVFRIRPVPFETGIKKGWKDFESQCIKMICSESSEERDRQRIRKEKAREVKRSRQIYFGGVSGIGMQQSEDSEISDDSGENGASSYSLPFFAAVCASLAVGAFASPRPDSMASCYDLGPFSTMKESPAFFYAFAQQVLGVWDTHISTLGSTKSVVDEHERLEYLLACLLNLQYLILSNSTGVSFRRNFEGISSPQLRSLVGKMVNAARELGIGKDGNNRKDNSGCSNGISITNISAGRSNNNSGREWVGNDWKKHILSEVMFYDLFVADVLGYQPNASLCSVNVDLLSSFAQQDSTGFGDDINHSANFMDHIVTGVEEDDYLAVRSQLTRIAQRVKAQLAHPDCCCGYTYDHAARLEDEIRRWQSGLPHYLKFFASSPENLTLFSTPVFGDQENSFKSQEIHHSQSCELAIMTSMLVIKLYTPFLRLKSATSTPASQLVGTSNPDQTTSASGFGSTNLSGAVSPVLPAAQAVVQAALVVIRAAKSLRSHQKQWPRRWTFDFWPVLFDFYPLDKVLYNAIVIGAHASLTGKVPAFSTDGDTLIYDVESGLECLLTFSSLEDTKKSTANSLRARLQQRKSNFNSLKRKHSRIDLEDSAIASSNDQSGFNRHGISGEGNGDNRMISIEPSESTNGVQLPVYLHNGLPVTQQHSNLIDTSTIASPSQSSMRSASSLSGTLTHDQAQLGEQPHKTQSANALTSAPSRFPSSQAAEKGRDQEKDKKHVKKSHVYPSVGIRIRPGKDGLPLSRSRTHSVSGPNGPPLPLLTSTPRPLPSAETVLAYQMQQKQKIHNVASGPISSIAEEDLQGSHSSSTSQSQSEYPRRRQRQPSNNEFSQPYRPSPTGSLQQTSYNTGSRMEQQPFSPSQSSYTNDSRSQDHSHVIYEQPQSSYDSGSMSSVPRAEGVSFNSMSSPFTTSNGPPSSSGSPFGSTSNASSGHPSTPTLNGHRPTPPVFGPQPPPPTNPPTYYQTSNTTFNGSYGTATSSSSATHPSQHQRISIDDIPMDQSLSVTEARPPYDENRTQQQSSIYDVKPNVVKHSQLPQLLETNQQHMSHQSAGPASHTYSEPGMDPMSMGLNIVSPWGASQQQQPQMTQSNQAFWNNGDGYRFYS